MRGAFVAGLMLAALPAWAQDQQQALNPPAGPPAGQQVYDIVAADRETAWRINRQTGEVTVCKVDTASLDGVRARCAPAIVETAPQQSQLAPGGIKRP
jgi:hypothetical protein